jgi:hypothetical protein
MPAATSTIFAFPDHPRVALASVQTFDDVAWLSAELPEVTEGEDKHGHGHRTWQVGGKAFAWERPFSKADIRRYGDQTPPAGPILAVRVRTWPRRRPYSPPTQKPSSRSRISTVTAPLLSSWTR